MIDLAIRGGAVYDGLGTDPRIADLGIDQGRIFSVGDDVPVARREIDAAGLSVAPGFIDPHAHSDMIPLLLEPQPFKLLQGVTTEIVGNCGFSFAPFTQSAAREAAESFGDLTADVEISPGSFGDYVDRIAAAGPTNNLAVLVGHNTLRLTANGTAARLREGALEEMCRLLDEAFDEGAAGLSTGLPYSPGTFSDTDEVVALAAVAHKWHRPYATHIRDEGRYLAQGLDEALEIGRRARVRVQISHCKAAGRTNFGNSRLLLERLHLARIAGIDVRGDQYPYLAGGTGLSALLPAEVHEDGAEGLTRMLADARERRRLRAIAERGADARSGQWREITPEDILITSHKNEAKVGKTLSEIAGDSDAWDALCDLVGADPTASMVITFMDECDVRAIMADPLISIGSDNSTPVGLQHPRTWGCFPRFLGRYVRELELVSWAEAIRKVTSSVANHFGLTGRGWIGIGAVADVTVFDAQTIDHDGTYLNPAAQPKGIPYVLLEGRIVVDKGEFTGKRRGRVISPGLPQRDVL